MTHLKQWVAVVGTALLGSSHSTVDANALTEPASKPKTTHHSGNDSFLSKLGALRTSQATRDSRESSKSIGFTLANYQVDEAAGIASIGVKSDVCPASVNYSSRNGTATEDDYHAVKGTLNFTTDGSGGCYSERFSIPITDDSILEDSETIHLTLSKPSNGVELDQNQAVLTIIDNDNSTIGFSHLNYDVDEASALATITVERTNCVEGFIPPASVKALISGYYGTATSGSDYRALYWGYDGEQLTWNEDECGEKNFNVSIFEDSNAEGNETVGMNLTQPSGANIHQGGAILTIIDNDNSVVLGFSEEAYNVNEGEKALISVDHLGCGPQSPIVSVSYASSDGTATQEDYVTVNGILVGGKGVNCSWRFNVPTIDDTVPEDNETILLKLADITGDAKLGVQEAVLTIIDNDGSRIGFSQKNYVVNEDEPSATIRVERTDCVKNNPISVDYQSKSYGGTASSDDYDSVSGQLSWKHNQCIPLTFEIPIKDDSITEEDETVHLSLSQLSGATFTQNTATLTIIDNDQADAREVISDSESAEDDKVVKEMTVKMDLNQTDYTVSDQLIVNLETGGTGMADLYVAIVFPNGYFMTLREFIPDPTEPEGWRITWSFLNTPQPYFSFREAGASIGGLLYPIIDLQLPPNLPKGDYSACGVLVQPDAVEVLDQSHWIHWDCLDFKVY